MRSLVSDYGKTRDLHFQMPLEHAVRSTCCDALAFEVRSGAGYRDEKLEMIPHSDEWGKSGVGPNGTNKYNRTGLIKGDSRFPRLDHCQADI